MNLVEQAKVFDFSTGERFVFTSDYDLTVEEEVYLLEEHSGKAHALVLDRGLNYDIKAHHYSTVEDGDRIVDRVVLTWEFWKNGQ